MIYLFFATAIGIFLGTVARSMQQLGWLATPMQVSPSTHFVSFAQSILYRDAGLDVVWPQFLIVALIGGLFFILAILRFRSAAAQAST
jgi:ABC-2 type transport system permease protein